MSCGESDVARRPAASVADLSVAALLPLIFGFASLFEPFGRDQGIHASIAYALDQGLVTYRDVFNIKPPMTTLAHWTALKLFGHSMASIRIFDMIAMSLASIGILAACAAMGRGRVQGLVTAIAVSATYYTLGYWEHAQTDGWASFLTVGCVLLLLSAWRRPAGRARFALIAAAGATLAVAFAFKYTIAATGLLIFAPALARSDPARFLWRDLAWFVAGGVAVLAVLGTAMAAVGALGPFMEIQGFIRGYVALGCGAGASSIGGLIAILTPTRPLMLLLALAGLAVWAVGMATGRAPLFHVVLGLWLATGVVSGQAQGKGFIYHYLPIIPGYALLIGLAFESAAGWMRRRGVGRVARGAAVAATCGYLTLQSPGIWQGMRAASFALDGASARDHWALSGMGGDYDMLEAVAFSDELTTYRAPGDAIFVWGYETLLYFLQRTPPRYRYPYAWPFATTFYDGRYTADLLARLNASPPEHFIVQKRDATPWVTGRQEDSREVLALITPLAGFLADRYRLARETPRFDLWELRTD